MKPIDGRQPPYSTQDWSSHPDPWPTLLPRPMSAPALRKRAKQFRRPEGLGVVCRISMARHRHAQISKDFRCSSCRASWTCSWRSESNGHALTCVVPDFEHTRAGWSLRTCFTVARDTPAARLPETAPRGKATRVSLPPVYS